MEKLNTPERPEMDVTKRLNDIYERCEVNMLQLCEKFDAMEQKDFDPLQMPLSDIAYIQKVFPEFKNISPIDPIDPIEMTQLPSHDYTQTDTAFLRIWDSRNNIKFKGKKITINKTF